MISNGFGITGLSDGGRKQLIANCWACLKRSDKIADAPFHYQAVEHVRPGYRRCVFKSDTIYFRVGDEMISVLCASERSNQ